VIAWALRERIDDLAIALNCTLYIGLAFNWIIDYVEELSKAELRSAGH
jgi:hypothetical protein